MLKVPTFFEAYVLKNVLDPKRFQLVGLDNSATVRRKFDRLLDQYLTSPAILHDPNVRALLRDVCHELDKRT